MVVLVVGPLVRVPCDAVPCVQGKGTRGYQLHEGEAPSHTWMAMRIASDGWGLDLRWVESDGNVAHSATHDEPLTQYR